MTDRQAEARELAHARTLEAVARSKVDSMPLDHPQRSALHRKANEVSTKLREPERAFAAPTDTAALADAGVARRAFAMLSPEGKAEVAMRAIHRAGVRPDLPWLRR